MLLESHVYFQIHSLYHKINNRETRDTVTIQKCCMLLLLQRNFDIFRFSITFYFFYCRSRWEAFLSIISAMLFFCWFDRMFFFPFCSFSLSLSLSLFLSFFFSFSSAIFMAARFYLRSLSCRRGGHMWR
jgi:hypothetical protein